MLKGYNLYGLKVNSQFEFSRYSPRNAYKSPDVIIKIGKVERPASNQDGMSYKPYTIYDKDIYYQDLPTIAQYLIKGNKEVWIQPYPSKGKKIVSLFFMDSILPILLIKNGLFPVHASAVKGTDGIYLFSGARGEGKSTLATNLGLQGYPFVSDNLCVLRWDKNSQRFITKCYYPYAYLWRNSLPVFGKNFNEIIPKKYGIKVIRQKLFKFALNLNRLALKTYQPVKGICILSVINDDIPLKHDVIKGLNKITASTAIIHSHTIANVLMKHKELFYYNKQIAKHIDLINIKRSGITTNNELTKYVIDEILK